MPRLTHFTRRVELMTETSKEDRCCVTSQKRLASPRNNRIFLILGLGEQVNLNRHGNGDHVVRSVCQYGIIEARNFFHVRVGSRQIRFYGRLGEQHEWKYQGESIDHDPGNDTTGRVLCFLTERICLKAR